MVRARDPGAPDARFSRERRRDAESRGEWNGARTPTVHSTGSGALPRDQPRLLSACEGAGRHYADPRDHAGARSSGNPRRHHDPRPSHYARPGAIWYACIGRESSVLRRAHHSAVGQVSLAPYSPSHDTAARTHTTKTVVRRPSSVVRRPSLKLRVCEGSERRSQTADRRARRTFSWKLEAGSWKLILPSSESSRRAARHR